MEGNTPALRLVLVEWLDSKQPVAAWQWLSDLEAPAPARCVSVGFLAREETDTLVIVQNVADPHDEDGAQASGAMTIPRACVVSIMDLSPTGPCPSPSSRPSTCSAPASAPTLQAS